MPIKLGRKMSECCITPMKSEPDSEEFFPSVHLEWDKDYELPDEGTMTVKFRIARESREVKVERQSVDLELTEIVSVAGKVQVKEDDDTGEALDKLRAAYESSDDADEE